MINDLQQINGNSSEIIAKMSSNSIRADCNMKHFLIDKDEQLQFETRSREYCYDDRLRSCRHFCFVNVPDNSYVPLPPSLKNSWTCFWGLQVERNIPASGVRDVGHLFPLLGAQLFHIRHVRKKCASFRLAEQRKPIAIGFCNSLLIFFSSLLPTHQVLVLATRSGKSPPPVGHRIQFL